VLRKTFAADVFECPKCSGTRRVLASLSHGPVVRRVFTEEAQVQHRVRPAELEHDEEADEHEPEEAADDDRRRAPCAREGSAR
jgi:hypothetical protein